MYIVNHRGLFFTLTGIVVALAIAAMIIFHLPLGIDFTGGSLIQIQYPAGRPALASIQAELAQASFASASVRPQGADSINIRTRTLTPEEHAALLSALTSQASTASTSSSQATELSYTSIGPALGSQFTSKALWAILAVLLVIVIYIAFAFRKVSRPVPSWGYGLTIVAILVHDLIIPTGFYAVLAHYTGAEVDSLFITALLALMGYSINDTIVIFDRVREHLRNNEKTNLKEEFATTVGKSIRETMTRSINTSLTVVLALLALIILGASATRDFALVMLVGVIAGTYSSILLAAPLLVPMARWFAKK